MNPDKIAPPVGSLIEVTMRVPPGLATDAPYLQHQLLEHARPRVARKIMPYVHPGWAGETGDTVLVSGRLIVLTPDEFDALVTTVRWQLMVELAAKALADKGVGA